MKALTASVCTGWTAKREEAMRAATGVRPKTLLLGTNKLEPCRMGGKLYEHTLQYSVEAV